jgi:hypothetical protein
MVPSINVGLDDWDGSELGDCDGFDDGSDVGDEVGSTEGLDEGALKSLLEQVRNGQLQYCRHETGQPLTGLAHHLVA